MEIHELSDIFDRLQKRTAELSDKKIEPLKMLEESALTVGKSWSGSWLGYHSLVYYKDFATPPPGAHFSSEWGLNKDIMFGTKGNWVEYKFDSVRDHILTVGGKPDLSGLNRNVKDLKELFEECITDTISILDTYLSSTDDKFVNDILGKVNELNGVLKHNWIDFKRPTGKFMSRDAIAINQGLWTPPHLAVIDEIYNIRAPIAVCEDLRKQIRSAISHLKRQEKVMPIKKIGGDKVFIGHGKSLIWKDLKDFIKDRLGLPIDEFNRIPIAGITNISRLSEMMDSSVIAFLVFTAEDEQPDGKIRARMNVIHEAGLFQGRLGFTKAIILLEEGCDEFSNIQGLGQIRFPKEDIKAVFEEVRLVLEREGVINVAFD